MALTPDRTTVRSTGGRSVSRLRGNPWWTLVATALAVIMVGLDGTVVAIANPYIGRDLHASLADLQWVTNAYLLALAVLLIVGGKLGDRYGRRAMFLIGVLGFAVMSVGVALAGSIDGVVAFRAAQGAFGALLLPSTLALLRAAFPPTKLNTAVGIWGAASAMATAAGPIVGGLLVENVSWQSVFYINAPIGAITLLIGLVALADSRESVRGRIDVPGVVTLGLGLFAVVFALVKAQTWSWSGFRTIGLLAGGLAVLAVFVLIENVVPNPLLPLRVFRNRSVSLGALAVVLNFFALMGVLFFVSLYLQTVHGYSPVQAGARTLPLLLMFAISSPLGATVTQRLGPRPPIVGGLLAVAAALCGMLPLGVDSSYMDLWPPFVLLGFGVGMVLVAATEAIVGNIPVDDAGIAGGVQSTALQLGGVLGTSIMGSVLAARIGATLAGRLADAGIPGPLARHFTGPDVTQFVGEGATHVPPGTPAPLAHAITLGSHEAFMAGLHAAMVVGAVVAVLGALLGLLVRRATPHVDSVAPLTHRERPAESQGD